MMTLKKAALILGAMVFCAPCIAGANTQSCNVKINCTFAFNPTSPSAATIGTISGNPSTGLVIKTLSGVPNNGLPNVETLSDCTPGDPFAFVSFDGTVNPPSLQFKTIGSGLVGLINDGEALGAIDCN